MLEATAHHANMEETKNEVWRRCRPKTTLNATRPLPASHLQTFLPNPSISSISSPHHTLKNQPTQPTPPMPSPSSSRPSPIIVITGTPGTGKSTHAELLASESPIPLRHLNVGRLVKERGLYESYDEEWESYEVDEDKVRFLFFFAISLLFTFTPLHLFYVVCVVY